MSEHDKQREGGGLVVLLLAGFLALLLLVAIGIGARIFYHRMQPIGIPVPTPASGAPSQ